MSTPAPPRPAGTLQAAQQQLDELEALIQRMLAVPSVPSDEPTPEPESPNERPSDEVSAVSVGEAMETVVPPAFEPLPEPLHLPSQEATKVLVPTPNPIFPVPPEGDIPAAAEQPPFPTMDREEAPPPEEPESPRTPGGRLPRARARRQGVLVRCNYAFDRWTFPLGRAGHWLRSPTGRDILGWSGVALLIVAVLWALLDWVGWTW
jgi:hypothetical protein